MAEKQQRLHVNIKQCENGYIVSGLDSCGTYASWVAVSIDRLTKLLAQLAKEAEAPLQIKED